jgi:hypothetical protein
MITQITQIVLWIIGAAMVAAFVARAWGWSGRLWPKTRRSAADATTNERSGASPGSGGQGRPQLVRAGLDATVALALVRALAPPPGWGSWIWVAGAVAVGVGVAGAILRWGSLSPARTGRREGWWPTALYTAIAGGLLVVLA